MPFNSAILAYPTHSAMTSSDTSRLDNRMNNKPAAREVIGA
jgi:hypothetical protein